MVERCSQIQSKVDTNVGRLAVRLGWSLSNHYWCRYPECKLYGKTSKESHMVIVLVEGVGKELLQHKH
nr:hypothetical protein [Tanacetum cinerariifolium]